MSSCRVVVLAVAVAMSAITLVDEGIRLRKISVELFSKMFVPAKGKAHITIQTCE